MKKYSCVYNSSENEFNFHHSITAPPPNPAIHIHDCYEIYYFLSGDVTYYIEGQTYQLKPNDLLIINNRELHRPLFNSDQPYERITIHFRPEYVSFFQTSEYSLLSYFEKRKLGHYNKGAAEEVLEYGIDRYFDQIEHYVKEDAAESPIMIRTLFVQMLIRLSKIFTYTKNIVFKASEYDKKIAAILDYINTHLHEKITLNMLEQIFFVNKYYLCHIFKKNTGFTVMEYVTYKRIMKAKELLALKTPVIETCHTVGFNDYSNFYKVFKKIVGTSPRNFMQK
ncbi:MAG: AraC family transcriptional regulator [Firmicutes bacterium]|nr:AraC family transcriptional regulator [Bacillota bacterium]